MTIKFESLTGSHESIENHFNSIENLVNDIQILNCNLAIDQFQRPLLIMFIKIIFKSESDKEQYEVMKKGKSKLNGIN